MIKCKEEELDAVIAEDGPSGVSAAIAAAREGTTVPLADKNGSLEGAASASSVLLYWEESPSERCFISNVIFRKIVDK